MSVQHYLLRKSIVKQTHPNIFMTQHDLDESHLFRNRKIIPYHVVGKPEIIDKRLNNSQPEPQVLEEKKIIKIKTYNQYKKQMSQQQNQEEEPEFIQIDMEPSQVENEIQQVLQKQYKSEHYPLHKLSKADLAQAQKDEKIMLKFEKQQNRWQQRKIQSAQQCKRPVTQSVYNQIDADREKQEDRNLLDLIQTDAERYGNKLWERQLRSCSDQEQQKIIEKGHEIIRKSTDCRLYKRPRSFAERFEERSEKVNELVTCQEIQNIQVSYFKKIEVEGNNILIKETENLSKMVKEEKQKKQLQDIARSQNGISQQPSSKRKHQTLFKKILPAQKLNGSNEIIAINYDKQKLRQQGKLDIYKQFF